MLLDEIKDKAKGLLGTDGGWVLLSTKKGPLAVECRLCGTECVGCGCCDAMKGDIVDGVDWTALMVHECEWRAMDGGQLCGIDDMDGALAEAVSVAMDCCYVAAGDVLSVGPMTEAPEEGDPAVRVV